MNSENTAVKRNTGSIIAKCIIVFVVLGIVCSLSIWAWFTKNTTATAEGINVMAKAEGVEVSWNGKDYFYDLTDEDYSEPATDATGETGASTTDASSTTSNATTFRPVGPSYNYNSTLKLITGNGLKFFEPTVNRRTGTVFADSKGNWVGSDITDKNLTGKYIELDLYFRGTDESNIYLSGDSAAVPNDENLEVKNTSDYGNFSKDNIGSAARVAFLDGDGNTCKFIWPANYDHKLVGNSDGYKRVVNYQTHEIGYINGAIPDAMLHEADGKDYYIYLPYSYTDDPITQTSPVKAYKMEFVKIKGDKGLYVFDNWKLNEDNTYTKNPDIALPGRSNMDIPFIISNSSTGFTSTDVKNAETIKKNSQNVKDSSDGLDGSSNIKISDQYFENYNYNDTYDLAKITFSKFQDNHFRLVIGYNPDTANSTDGGTDYSMAAIILSYGGYKYADDGTIQSTTKVYDRLGYFPENQANIKYYPLVVDSERKASCALVSPKASAALSTTELYQKKSVKFSDNEQTKIESIYITFGEQFTAYRVNEIDELSNNEYKFKNNKSGTYVGISTDGTVTLQATETNAAKFKLTYDEDFNGPVLKTPEGYVLAIVNGDVTAVNTADNNVTFDVADAVTIFTGSSYKYETGHSAESYWFYDSTLKTDGAGKAIGKTELNSTSTPPLFYAPNDANEVGVCIAELNADNNYTAKIKLRIWVEGTDNEAQTPLADGIFDLKLHFTTRFATNNQ